MAQRDKNEESTELHAPEITLCANNCGFHGNPATKNLCQNCFLAATSASASASASTSSPLPPCSVTSVVEKPRSAAAAAAEKLAPSERAPEPEVAAAAPAVKLVNRCFSCRKRVGLTGFRCRCGDLFCGDHRYSYRHDCSYDYKAAARDAIARENPVVRAAKIVRF